MISVCVLLFSSYQEETLGAAAKQESQQVTRAHDCPASVTNFYFSFSTSSRLLILAPIPLIPLLIFHILTYRRFLFHQISFTLLESNYMHAFRWWALFCLCRSLWLEDRSSTWLLPSKRIPFGWVTHKNTIVNKFFCQLLYYMYVLMYKSTCCVIFLSFHPFFHDPLDSVFHLSNSVKFGNKKRQPTSWRVEKICHNRSAFIWSSFK